jgi:uncharacterized membrane protein HdeD (DUF308 family)
MEMERSLSATEREAVEGISRLWWLWLVIGIIWLAVALVILQFDDASRTTVGVIIGLMFLGAAAQQLVIAGLADRLKWLYALFGVLFVAAGVIALIRPGDTFEALASVLGFLFLLVGIFWIIQSFLFKEVNELWWLLLVAGATMVVIAFWTSGQLLIEKEYVLLVFAGVWAMLSGVTDIVRAFQIRRLGRLV